MKKILFMLTVLSAPLLAMETEDEFEYWDDVYQEQISTVWKRIMHSHLAGDKKQVNTYIFLLYCLINNEPPQNIADRFGYLD